MDKLIPLIKLCKDQEFKSSKSGHKKSLSTSSAPAPFRQRLPKRVSTKPQPRPQLRPSGSGYSVLNHSADTRKAVRAQHVRTSSEKVRPAQIDPARKVPGEKNSRKGSKHGSTLITPSSLASTLIRRIAKKNSGTIHRKENARERAPSAEMQKRSASFAGRRGKAAQNSSKASAKTGKNASLTRPNSSASKKRLLPNTHKSKVHHEQKISAQSLLNPFGKFVSKRKDSKKAKNSSILKDARAVYSTNRDKNPQKPIAIKALPKTPAISVPQSKHQSALNSPRHHKNATLVAPLSSDNLNKLKYRKEVEKLVDYIRAHFKEHKEGPPTTVDFYRVGRLLGKGAFGKVSLGMHKLTGKMVAVKSISKSCFTDEEARKKVMREFSILKLLKHQSVTRLYESFESKRHVLFIVELCAGGDLLNYVRRRRRLKEPIAQLIFKQLINGLEYCHYKGIIHRDIKLDNVLLNANGDIKIGDFGVSKCVKKGERMYEQCGTPAYIAPEILKDRGYEGFGADTWSAGVVLYALLYGTVPFKCNDMRSLQKRILKGKYSLKDDVSECARDLLRRMLETNPKKRITESEILAHPWMQQQSDKSLFTEAEKAAIRREYSCMRKTEHGTGTLFTEQNIDSTLNDLTKNATTKSAILAPFNSSQSEGWSADRVAVLNKQEVIRFSDKARDPDRQYEKCNNADFDQNMCKELVNVTKGASLSDSSNSIENSFDDSDSDYSGMFEEPAQTESTQPQSIFKHSMEKRQPDTLNEEAIRRVEAFGYPRQYIIDCLSKDQMNHTTAAYYLLLNN